MRLEQVKAEALKLSEEDQALLVDELLTRRHGPIDPAIEKAHLDEVERRYSAYREGKMAGRPMGDVIRDQRAKNK